jgi:hypothetical protein
VAQRRQELPEGSLIPSWVAGTKAGDAYVHVQAVRLGRWRQSAGKLAGGRITAQRLAANVRSSPDSSRLRAPIDSRGSPLCCGSLMALRDGTIATCAGWESIVPHQPAQASLFPQGGSAFAAAARIHQHGIISLFVSWTNTHVAMVRSYPYPRHAGIVE